ADGSGVTEVNTFTSVTNTNALLLSVAANLLVDGGFETAISDNVFIIDDTAAITNALTGTNIILTRSNTNARTGAWSLKAAKTFGGGSACDFVIAVPLARLGTKQGMSLWYKKPGAGTGPVYFNYYYLALSKNSSGVPISARASAAIGSATPTFTADAVAYTRVQVTVSTPPPPWATHVAIDINMNSFVGPDSLYFDDVESTSGI
ncbi:MAG: hypothetical protein ABIW84_03795, partial [Ilumatobacteraceae bacterium]